jgi:hypothetical protein
MQSTEILFILTDNSSNGGIPTGKQGISRIVPGLKASILDFADMAFDINYPR